MTSGNLKRIRVAIEGRVQGVGFRYWTQLTAQGLALDGWVRNRRDASVEAVFQGDAVLVDRMVAACRSGPPGARVERIVSSEWSEQVPAGFEILPTI
jgi:acylphosphatase